MVVGSNKMKQVIFIIATIFLFDFSATAANPLDAKQKINVKCHIEMMGGQQAIYLARIKKQQLKQLPNTLPNRKISTLTSKDKQQVYKVFECILLQARFSSVKANLLFEEQPR